MSERMEFKSEAKQLLNLVIHSLYSHKEIFLRELVSNASDALDKLRFQAVTDDSLAVDPANLEIKITADPDNNRLTISDNGIGMDRDDLINNLGTIARSGSKAFLETLSGDAKKDSNLIGQFGVGFYSVFMVASKVEVLTRKVGTDSAFRWISEGDTSFEIEEAARLSHGTDIIITLNEDEKSFTESWQLRSLVKKYSNYVAFPILLPVEDKEKEGEFEQVNETKPLWKRDASEITDEEYESFYSQACGGFGKPLKTIHTKAEGTMEYAAVAFIPDKVSPFEMNNVERKHGMKLYVRRVFISDDVAELMPQYFRFVKGVVDTEDLPLNVSREIIQENAIIKKIGKALTGKIFTELNKMGKKKPEEYALFWKEFGQIIKEGLHTDWENRDKVLELVRFNTTTSGADTLVSFQEYVDRMPEKQKHIYYITGENYATVSQSPHLEVFREKGVEVIILTDPIDEFVIPGVPNVLEKELKSITEGDLDLGELGDDKDSDSLKADEKRFKKFLASVKETLSDKVSDVRLTNRLKESPACLVNGEGSMSPQIEQMMKAMGQAVPESKRILELNASHPIVEKLNNIENGDDVKEWVTLLYEQALIAEGSKVPDQNAYLKRVTGLMEKVLQA